MVKTLHEEIEGIIPSHEKIFSVQGENELVVASFLNGEWYRSIQDAQKELRKKRVFHNYNSWMVDPEKGDVDNNYIKIFLCGVLGHTQYEIAARKLTFPFRDEPITQIVDSYKPNAEAVLWMHIKTNSMGIEYQFINLKDLAGGFAAVLEKYVVQNID